MGERTSPTSGVQISHAAMKIYLTEVVKNVQISSVPMSTRKKTRSDSKVQHQLLVKKMSGNVLSEGTDIQPKIVIL